jgi:hypothetical protein
MWMLAAVYLTERVLLPLKASPLSPAMPLASARREEGSGTGKNCLL